MLCVIGKFSQILGQTVRVFSLSLPWLDAARPECVLKRKV
jgi:hypothetical protein